MNFLLDESVDRAIADRLRSEGHDIVAIAELSPSITDEVVLRRALELRAILITADKDFGELVFRLGRMHAGIILLRLPGLPDAAKALRLSDVLRDREPELDGAFTVITARLARVRRIAEG